MAGAYNAGFAQCRPNAPGKTAHYFHIFLFDMLVGSLRFCAFLVLCFAVKPDGEKGNEKDEGEQRFAHRVFHAIGKALWMERHP